MGYGGTGYATVSVSIAQADVQAIVDGITGYYGRTLTDIDNDLGNYLYYNGNSAAALLQWLLDQMGSATSALYDIENYLSGSCYGNLYDGNRAVDYLNWISSNTSNTAYYLYDGNRAVDYLNWISSNTGGLQGYLAGWNGGPLSDISYYLSGNGYGALYDGNSAVSYLNWINGNTSSTAYYLYDYNTYQSAASLLADIRNILQQLSFDGSGRLRVTTTG